MKISCIYSIINIRNNKRYIGSTRNYQKRHISHINQLKNNKHYNFHLQAAWNKYGEENFKFEILEEVQVGQLIKIETKYIDLYKSSNSQYGYNQQEPSNSRAGLQHSVKSRALISKNRMGKGHSEQTKQQISQTMKNEVCKNRPQESYDRMAKTKRNKPIPSLYKKVRCIELNVVFNSIEEAANQLDLHRTGISMVLSGKMKRTGGYTFERA